MQFYKEAEMGGGACAHKSVWNRKTGFVLFLMEIYDQLGKIAMPIFIVSHKYTWL